jgi:hypothetical protein
MFRQPAQSPLSRPPGTSPVPRASLVVAPPRSRTPPWSWHLPGPGRLPGRGTSPVPGTPGRGTSSVPDADAVPDAAVRYTKLARIFADIFVKRFFIAKILCTYTMNYLQQEKCLRDHGGHSMALPFLSGASPEGGPRIRLTEGPTDAICLICPVRVCRVADNRAPAVSPRDAGPLKVLVSWGDRACCEIGLPSQIPRPATPAIGSDAPLTTLLGGRRRI